MFKRQARQPFPVRNIFLFALIVLFFLFLLLRYLRQETPAPPPPPEPGAQESTGSALRPAEWFHYVREYPDFRTDIKSYTQAIARVGHGVVERSYPGFSAPWTVQGPANIGARINSIKVHPTNPNIIYAGYSQGGVWKTNNGGQSWIPIFDKQSFLGIGDIELDPQNPNTVYVGTGDPNISGYPFIGDGLWKSTNGGQSWQHLGLEDQRIISKIIVHPTDANTIFVAAMGLPFERNNARGLYKTTNGGQSWQQVLFISDSTGIIDMALSPAGPDVLYAASWDRIRNDKESTVSGDNARIWKSVDGGDNWTVLGGGLPQGPFSRVGLDISATDPDYLVSVYVDTSLGFYGIYRTDDGGNSWSLLPDEGLNPGFMANFGWYFGKIFINPYDPNDIFVCGVTLYRSLDGGENWFQTTPDWWLYEVHADMHDMAFVDANTCLLATDGGLYKSIDNGFSWEKIENIPTSQFYRVAYSPFSPDWYYGGMQDNGTSGGNADFINDWPRFYGGDGFQAVFHPEDPNIFYFETQNGNIVGTTDGGNFYESADVGIEPGDRRHWDMQYILSKHDLETMYAGTYRIYQGFGHLPIWVPISDDLTDGVIYGNRFHTISTLDESPLDPSLLYVGTTDGNVWRGNPGAQTWTNISAGLPDRYVSSVKASPNITNRVYVAHTGYKANDFTARLHRSDNQGNTWASIAGDLPDLAINDVFVLPGHQDSLLFVATDGGVFGTLDGGQHWERLGTGMPVVPVYDLEWNPVQRTLIAGTYARSIMTFPLDSLQGGDVSTGTPGGPKAPVLAVTPNPATDRTVVITELTSTMHETEIIVADLSGRILWQFQFKGVLRRETPLDIRACPPGVYVAFARTNGRIWGQQKFVVAR